MIVLRKITQEGFVHRIAVLNVLEVSETAVPDECWVKYTDVETGGIRAAKVAMEFDDIVAATKMNEGASTNE